MKIGIVGCGKFASRRIVPAIAVLPECSLFGVQSRSLEKVKHIEAPFKTNSCEELIFHPEIEAIIICSPHHLHKEQLTLCARRNIPVLCEKPLSISYTEFQEVLEFFPEQTPLLVGQCYRLKDSILQTKEWIETKQIGDLLSLQCTMHIPIPRDNWRFQQEAGGGVLLDIGIHIIDTIHFLTGSFFQEIYSIGRIQEVETTVDILGRLDNGAHVSFSISFEYPYETGFIVTGTQGTLKGAYIFRQADDEKEKVQFISKSDEIFPLSIDRRNIYEKEMIHFVKTMQTSEPSLLDARKMGENYRVLEQIKESLMLANPL